MKTIVNIPDYLYEHLNEFIRGSMSSMLILDYVKQGTPLPKGHGRIVDENEITSFGWNYKANHASVNAPTIIEADKGEEEMTNGEEMDFPDTFDEFAEDYGFKDEDEVYTNGSELIQVYRVKQWLEHINKTTTAMIDESDFSQDQYKADLQSAYDCGYEQAKNNLKVDCISRTSALDSINWAYNLSDAYQKINELPSVTPQLSSELEKNSQKLEKNFGELDCISRIETIDYLCKHCPDDGECFKDCDEIKHLRQMPSVTPHKPTTKENLVVSNIIDDIEGLTWYRVSNGQLTEGANSKTDTPLYKACDIEKILEKYRG